MGQQEFNCNGSSNDEDTVMVGYGTEVIVSDTRDRGQPARQEEPKK